MERKILNLGVLAHVDAGKTSLSERLLFDHGTISSLGSVDAGNTRTDNSDLERERGITIRSAVAPFMLGDLQVNLVDTPGHPDFIAEVERALAVLDGAILVISAVEGVQAQTRVLMKSLQKTRVPTLLFINKIDRMGARSQDLISEIRVRLSPAVVPMNWPAQLGSPKANVTPISDIALEGDADLLELLADGDVDILARVVDDRHVTAQALRRALARETLSGRAHPVYFGSALTGTGTLELAEGIEAFLAGMPAIGGDPVARGTVFAIERNKQGEKIAYLRLRTGELRERQEVMFIQREPSGAIRELPGRITGLEVVGNALDPATTKRDVPKRSARRGSMTAGNIGKIRGFPEIRVGAQLGEDAGTQPALFPPPTLESVVRPLKRSQETDLHSALMALSDEDPLIRTRIAGDGAVSVLLYGEVQKEVIAERLDREFGIKTRFDKTSPIFFERPAGIGRAEHEIDPIRHNDFWATVGIRVEPNPVGRGNSFTREVHWGLMPPGFYHAIEETALQTLEQGLYGWKVVDCAVFLTRLGYDRPMTVAADFRNLTPILVMRALKQAGTRIYEPCQAFEVEVPEDALGIVMRHLTANGAELAESVPIGQNSVQVSGEIPSRNVQDVAIALPALTQGEAVLFASPGADRAIRGEAPIRPRTDGNPLNFEEYMGYLSRNGLLR